MLALLACSLCITVHFSSSLCIVFTLYKFIHATDALDAASMQLTYTCTIYLVHNNQMPAASRLEAWVALMAIVVVLEVYV